MKHIKLFEDFSEEPDMYDALQIVMAHLGQVREIKIDSSCNAKNILKLEILENPTEDKIKSCKKHLASNEEGYDFFLYIPNLVFNDFIIVGVGNSIEEYLIKWLNENFGDLEPIKKENKTYYVDKDNLAAFYYPNDEKYVTFFTNDIILSFLSLISGMLIGKLQEITKNWIEDRFKLSAKFLIFTSRNDWSIEADIPANL
jgi:hypothetical protein